MKNVIPVVLVVLMIIASTGVALAVKPENPPAPPVDTNDPLSALWAAVNALQTAVNGLMANDTAHNTALSGLQTNDAAQNAAITELRANDTNHDALLSTLQTNASEQENQLNALKANDSAQETILSALILNASEQEARIAAVDSQCNCPISAAEYAALTANMTKLVDCQVGKLDCDQNWLSNGCEVNPATDVNNCGACGSICILSNATPICSGGACGVGSCTSGFGNCDNVAENGCEASLQTSTSHCGGCGNTCHDLPNAYSEVCVSGTCNYECIPDIYADCDRLASNGCEVRIYGDDNNCGSCGTVCPSNSHCFTGDCECYHQYLNCDGNWANGCEVDRYHDNNNCGNCGITCPADTHCVYDHCVVNS